MEHKIIGARETVKLDLQGNLVTYSVYTYMLDDYGPFTFEIPKSQDSSDALISAMLAKEKILQESMGGR
jgi:hypothetical protein